MKRKTRVKPAGEKVGNATVKIYQRRRRTIKGKWRTIFEVEDKTGEGRVLRGFSDEAKAKKEANRIASQLSSGDATAAKMLNREAASYGRAIELLRPSGISLEIAAATVAQAVKLMGRDGILEAVRFYVQHNADKIIPRTTQQVVTELIEARQARNKSVRYVADLRARLGRFADVFRTDISSITGPDIQGWLDKLTVAPRTIKNFQSSLSTLFSFAESRGYIPKNSNPVETTETIDDDGGGTIEIFTIRRNETLDRGSAGIIHLPVV